MTVLLSHCSGEKSVSIFCHCHLKSLLSLIQTKPSYPGLLWTATSLNLHKAEKSFYCYYFLSGCLQSGPGVSTSPGDMLLFKHSCVHHAPMCWPGTSAPTSHTGTGLGSGLMLHCPVWLCCCLLSSLLVFSSPSKLEMYLQKEPGGSSQPYPQTSCVHWQEEIKTSPLPLPASYQLTSIFKPCLSFPGHKCPTAFSCLL